MHFFEGIKESKWATLYTAGGLVLLIVLIQWLSGNYFVELFSLPDEGPDPTHPSFISWQLFTSTWGFSVWWLLLIWGFLVKLSGHSFQDLGIHATSAYGGILFFVVLWALTQFGMGLEAAINNSIAFNKIGALELIGFFIGLFAIISAEEVVFRGFFLPQIYIKCRQLLGEQWNRKSVAIIAVLITSLFFALVHVSSSSNFSPASLLLRVAMITLLGSIFAAIYMRTKNLFVCVGVHTLINNPLPVVTGNQYSHFIYVSIFSLILVLIWPYLQTKIRRTTASSS